MDTHIAAFVACRIKSQFLTYGDLVKSTKSVCFVLLRQKFDVKSTNTAVFVLLILVFKFYA